MTPKWLQKYNILAFDIIDSTNNEAKRLIQSGISDNIIIWTKQQTAGRGRYGREWKSRVGNLLMSIALPISCELIKAAQLSFVTGIAVYKVIDFLAKKQGITLPISLKWPNDIYIQDNKIGGILLESLTVNNQQWIVIGLGLNIEHAPNIDNASSLMEYGVNVYLEEALDAIITEFDYYNGLWEKDGFSSIRSLWTQHAYRLGQKVTVGGITHTISGIFESINNMGSIQIRLDCGELQELSTGEMFFSLE